MRTLLVSAALVALVACKRGDGTDNPGGAQSADGGATVNTGPQVKVAAGTLKAGSPCGATPRITNEELVGDSIAMGEFSIDVLPYPNDPLKPMRVDVTREEAASLCAEAGKRLCTELEWERACKGPNNTTFEYGAGYTQANCKTAMDLLPDKRPKCVSGFGVKDMHGLAWEWTDSAWGRGTSGDLATVRGGPATLLLQARCANGQGRPAATKAKDVGFRCCSGPKNASVVNVTPTRLPPMVDEPSVEAGLAAAMLKVMPTDHRGMSDVDVSFDKLWRWHPRDSEELLIGRWAGKPKDGKAPFYEIAVFKPCSGVPVLIARMRGPVVTLGAPGAGADPQKASVYARTGDDHEDLKISYAYGMVSIEQPAWIKMGNRLVTEDKKLKIRPTKR